MADRSLRNVGDKNSDNSSREFDLTGKRKRSKKSATEKVKKRKQVKEKNSGIFKSESCSFDGTETTVEDFGIDQQLQENSKKKAANPAANKIKEISYSSLQQSGRVTRSQWRQSIAEQSKQLEQEKERATAYNIYNSSNPASRSSSASSSRAASPTVFRLKSDSVTTTTVLSGRGRRRSVDSSRSTSPVQEDFLCSQNSPVLLEPNKRANSLSCGASSRTGSPESLVCKGKGRKDQSAKNSSSLKLTVRKEKLEGYNTTSKAPARKQNNSQETRNKQDSRSNKTVIVNPSSVEESNQFVSVSLATTLLDSGHLNNSAESSTTDLAAQSTQCKTSPRKVRVTAKSKEGLATDFKTSNAAKQKQNRKRPRSASQAQEKTKKRDKKQADSSTSDSKQRPPDTAKTGGRLSRTRTSQAHHTGQRRSTTGSCASSRRSSRRSRAEQEPGAMETDDARNGQQVDNSVDNPRVEEPVAGASGSRDNDSNLVEDLEMSRLQALLEARGLPSHLFGNLGPRMHLLLQRTFSSGAGTKAQQLLTGMQSESEDQQLTSVMEMCQLLVMGNEDTLGGFPVKQAVPVLTNHACRALTYLMEALPRSSAVVVDAIPGFLEKLQVIQCMDVAEQSLTALEMLSRRHSKSILQAGGLNSCLLYLDFFSIAAQRCALGIAANCCQSVTIDDFHHVKDTIAILSGKLTNQDKKSIDNVCTAFARLVDNFQRDRKLIEEVCAHDLLRNLQQLVIITPPILNTSTFTMVLRMLAVMCANCPSIAVRLLKQNFVDTIRSLLIGNPSEETPDASTNELVPRTPQELYEITCLVSELLPSLPSTGVFSVDPLLVKGFQQNANSGCWQWRDDRGIWHNYMWVDNRIIETAHQTGEDEISLSTLGRNYIIDFANSQQINEDTGTIRPIQRKATQNDISTAISNESEGKDIDERKIAFDEDPLLAEYFVQSLMSIMYDVYYSSVGPAVKHKCLNAVLKMLCHSNENCLEAVVEKLPISSYIAGMLTSNDHRVVCCALQKSDILMNKLPNLFHVSFRREGVMHRALAISQGDSSVVSKSPEKPKNCDVMKRNVTACHSELVKSDDELNSMLINLPKSPSEGRIAEVTKKKKSSKRLGRHRQSQASTDDTSSSISKKVAASNSRARASTFSSASNSPSGSSKASFFSSFAPRWGRSHSYTNAAASVSKELLIKEPDQNKEKIKCWIKDQATSFYKTYFSEEDNGDSHPALNILHRLTNVADNLSLEKDAGLTALKELNDVLKEKNEFGACAFEIVHSGLITSLLQYLTHDLPFDAVPRSTRIKRFLHIFLGCPDPDLLSTRSIEPSVKPSLPSLVQKLNLCISQLEQFPVKCHEFPGAGSGSRGTSALRFFNTHQIKCNLQRHVDCHNVRQWKGGTVKIDPLALVQAVERYLVIRGFGRVREHGDDDDTDDDDGTDGEIDEAWGSAIGTGKPKHYLELILNGRVLSYDMTIYQAVRQYGDSKHGEDKDLDDDQGPLGRASIWSDTHTIWEYVPIVFPPPGFRRIPFEERGHSGYRTLSHNSSAFPPATKKRSEASSSSSKISYKNSARNMDKERNPDPGNFLTDTLPAINSTNDPSLQTICLMRVLYFLNLNWGNIYEIYQPHAIVSIAEFLNAKLSAKVSRQLQDPLVIMTGNIPSWLSEVAKACPFLFPFECRQQLFYSTTFDRDRALMKLQESVPELASADTADRVTPRLEKKKRTVPRTDLLKQAENVMNDVAGGKAILEIQYEGEVGTGLGPTLEFYTLVSKELQKADLQIWRGEVVKVVESSGESKDISSYVHSTTGLFPVPLPKNVKASQFSKIKSRFRFLGKFVAKAMMDSRMIDIPFSQPFCKWMLGHESTLQLSDMQYLDVTIYKSLNQLNDIVKRKKAIERDHSHTSETLRLALANVTLDGSPIEDLSLDFVLPGYSHIELKKNGKDIPVTIDNLEEYIRLVVHWSLVDGVVRQMNAFKEGFETVFPLSSIQMFYASEIDLLLCGSRNEKWDVKEMMECCRPDHGYTHDSCAVRYLFEILSKYDSDEQRKFLQFITGSPRLPVGGFRSLNPPLTIVRKTVESTSSPDNYLPSVMTCVNYLKLPDYSSIEVMSNQLRTAYTEGKNAFHLS
eukprot:gene11042-12207_t